MEKKRATSIELTKIDQFSQPPKNVENGRHRHISENFGTMILLNGWLIRQICTAWKKTGKSFKTNKEGVEKFIGVQMLMSIVKRPRYEMYWSLETSVEQVTSPFSLKCYKKICEFLHAVDNTEKEKEESKGDRLCKVKPLLDAVRANCLKMEPERIHSIDEQIIQAKTKRSEGVRQYNKKLHKWGFKNLVRASQQV